MRFNSWFADKKYPSFDKNAMKHLLIFCCLLLSNSLISAQDTSTIKPSAEIMLEAMMKEDYKTLLKYTYPKVVALGGGAEKMVAQIKKSVEEMKNGGMTFRRATLGEVGKIYKAGKELHCVLPETTFMNVKGGYVTGISPLLCISSDGGKSWTFVHGGNMTPQKIKMLFPNFNYDLVLEKTTEPVFHKE
jgi:hypothetical protein